MDNATPTARPEPRIRSIRELVPVTFVSMPQPGSSRSRFGEPMCGCVRPISVLMPGVRFIATAAAMAVMVVVAGCASPGATGAGPTPHGSSSRSVSAAEANRAAAVAEARRILATYLPPAGATRLAHPPKGLLSSPALGTAVSPKYQVDDVAWFTVAHGDA